MEFEVFVTDADSGVDQTVVVLREITVERDVRRQLERQERLAAIGQMAAGIAHDFNNVLFAIVTNTEVLIRDERLPPAVVDRARSIAEVARRGGGIIRQILDFSRKSVSARRPLDLSEFVRETMALMRRAIPQNVDLRFDPPSEECRVLADPARLEQLLTNLVVNARDAMPEGGNITVSMSRRLAADGRTDRFGKWVSLEVKDSGPGIPHDLQHRVFEPYFTTKGPEQGTGLGLAQVLGIVQDHGVRSPFRAMPTARRSRFSFLPSKRSPWPRRSKRRSPRADRESWFCWWRMRKAFGSRCGTRWSCWAIASSPQRTASRR
jgi:signal transduction histidine kinase